MCRQNQSLEKEIHLKKKYITFDSSIYTIDNSDISVPNFMENSIGLKRVNLYFCRLIY